MSRGRACGRSWRSGHRAGYQSKATVGEAEAPVASGQASTSHGSTPPAVRRLLYALVSEEGDHEGVEHVGPLPLEEVPGTRDHHRPGSVGEGDFTAVDEVRA